ncbi:pilus assembly protein Flp/PilA [Sphingomonas laterariae]|uniref:Pilus assembly protein Flp/PilA n=1 Tax=Edaphosphingomonas laterariae TaxID=861865 RepID=A0A239DXU7_9SPHN|nr:Flp family type IVb pilin [Sphingomonas laterariae]SNS36543.1 pilus assembly protein Flp/PilA [Sphingomonas laterariae]
MRKLLSQLIHDRKGATAIEYGLILALIALTMMAGLSQLGGTAGGMWDDLENKVVNAT